MNRNFPLYLYGAIIMIVGIFLFLNVYFQNSYHTIRITVGISLLLGAILAFMTALSKERKHVQFAYHEMHALAMLIYGLLVLFFSNTFETLTNLTSFLFFYYSFSEIIFCFWIFNLHRKVVYKIVIIRSLLAIAMGIGTIVIMQQADLSIINKLQSFGILFSLIGLNILLYVPILKLEVKKD